ncbi:MAG: hypothetical protein ABFC63_10240 [Thermoguttaceae bacterium]
MKTHNECFRHPAIGTSVAPQQVVVRFHLAATSLHDAATLTVMIVLIPKIFASTVFCVPTENFDRRAAQRAGARYAPSLHISLRRTTRSCKFKTTQHGHRRFAASPIVHCIPHRQKLFCRRQSLGKLRQNSPICDETGMRRRVGNATIAQRADDSPR